MKVRFICHTGFNLYKHEQIKEYNVEKDILEDASEADIEEFLEEELRQFVYNKIDYYYEILED